MELKFLEYNQCCRFRSIFTDPQTDLASLKSSLFFIQQFLFAVPPMSDAIVISSNMDHHHHGYQGSASGYDQARASGGPRRSLPHSESFSTTDPSKLSDHELDCLKEAFSLFDADHDGKPRQGTREKHSNVVCPLIVYMIEVSNFQSNFGMRRTTEK